MGNVRSVKPDFDIAIVGGGASGLLAAITAAKSGKRVALFESGDRVGKKLLATGNGKCNLSHTNITQASYYGSGKKYIEDFLKVFGTEEVIDFFKSAGMLIRNKDGYLYPYSETAQTVVDALRFSIDQNSNIKVFTLCKIIKIKKNSNSIFELSDEHGDIYTSEKAVICTGGKAYPKTGSDGNGYKLVSEFDLDVVKPRPALCKLISDEIFCKAIDGVRSKGKVTLLVDNHELAYEDGEIQFTKDGLSGIPIFNVSRIASYAVADKKKICISLDLVPDLSCEQLIDFYKNKEKRGLNAENFFLGTVNKKINASVLNICGIKFTMNAEKLTKDDILSYCQVIKSLRFNITGVYGFDYAQVSAGGIHFDEVNEKLESRKCSGLYFAGEILDIDGMCGGYNLQWAWTSGYIVGKYSSL